MPPEKKQEIKELKEEIKEQKQETKSAKSKAKQAIHTLKNETKKQIILAFTAAFGFLIALVWRDVIKSYVDKIISQLAVSGPESLIMLYTAIITTILAVIGIILINRWGSKQ